LLATVSASTSLILQRLSKPVGMEARRLMRAEFALL
jgi:hypothetical protein